MKKLSERNVSNWQTNVREIAEALGLEVTPSQWVTIDNGDGDGRTVPMTGRVEIAVWESFGA